ncbi:MAG: leucine-rich repeat domain-containing protein [Candidatus Helarchaeota archaeon]
MEKIKDLRELNAIKRLKEKYHLEDENIIINEKGQVISLNLSEKGLKIIPFEIKNLPNLQFLDLSGNEIKKIEGLFNLTSLIILYLGRNQIDKIEGLNNLSELKTLVLSRNLIEKIEGLDKLTNLKVLFLDRNQITKMEGLNNLLNLEMLFLTWNKIKKIEGINNLTQLTTLYLTRNQISKLEGLENLENLKSFRIHENPLYDEEQKIYENGIDAVIEKCKKDKLELSNKAKIQIKNMKIYKKASNDFFLFFYDFF